MNIVIRSGYLSWTEIMRLTHPFGWWPGRLCFLCMPEMLTRTKVLGMLKRKKLHVTLECLDRINKRSPYGTCMTLYLSIDVYILINTVTKNT